MTFSLHPEASAEFEGAVAYYEERQRSLGLDLALAVQAAIQNIVSFPHAWPGVEGEIRRCLVHRFPYGILYTVEPTEIWGPGRDASASGPRLLEASPASLSALRRGSGFDTIGRVRPEAVMSSGSGYVAGGYNRF